MGTYNAQQHRRTIQALKSVVWPVFHQECFPHHDGTLTENTKLLDMGCGIDLILSPKPRTTGSNFGVSVRIRTVNRESFTLRDTEFTKRAADLRDNAIRPSFHLQAHVVNNTLASFGLIEMDKLIQFMVDHGGLTNPRWPLFRKSNNGFDDHDFLAVDFKPLQAANIEFKWWTSTGWKTTPEPQPPLFTPGDIFDLL